MKTITEILNLNSSHPYFVMLFCLSILIGLYLFGYSNFNQLIASKFNMTQHNFHYVVFAFVVPLFIYSIYGITKQHKSYDIPEATFYCSLENDYTCNSKNSATPILVKSSIAKKNLFDKDGFHFSKDNGYVLGFSENLPTGTHSRTATMWFKINESLTFDEAKKTAFLFSYGKTGDAHNQAFGLQIGIPEIQSAQEDNYRDFALGLRVFTYCKQGTTKNQLDKCDYKVFDKSTIRKNVWYFVSLVYDSEVEKFKVYLGEKDKGILESEYIGDAKRDKVEVAPTNYVYIGNIVSEFSYFSLTGMITEVNQEQYHLVTPKGSDYIAFSTKKWIFDGHIRELSIYDKVLTKDEINYLYQQYQPKTDEKQTKDGK